MDASTWAAWWGAIVGTSAVAWQIFCWFRSGPRLKVTASTNMQVVSPDQGTDETLYINVVVVNVGDKPTTLTHLCGHTYRNRLDRLRGKREKIFVINTGPESPIPHKIEVGDRWSAMVGQDSAEKLAGTSILSIGVQHSMQSKPTLKAVRLPPTNG